MKIISYSDIHLEHAKDLRPPQDTDADLMILSGDILNIRRPVPLRDFLAGWNRPVIYVPGNHEYYNDDAAQDAAQSRTMAAELSAFRTWLGDNLPQVVLLDDAAVEIDGVHFFGGTMWTDYAGGDETAMTIAAQHMHDYRRIYTAPGTVMVPADTLPLHAAFRDKLIAWLETPMDGPRVVITHHAPALNPLSAYDDSPIIAGFNSLDMLPVIQTYKPDFWFYGHTHECDRQVIGTTRLVSNQLGYKKRADGDYECAESFDPLGAPVEVPAAINALRQAV